MKINVYKDKAGKWRWRQVARNGQKMAASGEAYYSKYNAVRAARNIARRLNCKVEIQK